MVNLLCNGETVLEFEINPNHERIFKDLKIGSYEFTGQQENESENEDEDHIFTMYKDTLRLTRQDMQNLRHYLTGKNFNELKFEWEYAKKKLQDRVPTDRQTVEDLLLELTPTVLETQYDYKFLDTIFTILSFADKHPDQNEFIFTCERTDLPDNQASPTSTRPGEVGND